MANPIAGFPDAATTGVLSGTQLKGYTGPMTITKSGTVIENMIIDGSLRVMASDVVIKNCLIRFSGTWGVDAEDARNITIQDCDIIGPGKNDDSNAGILGSGNFLRNDISNSENGIVLSSGSSTVKGNYIHDLSDGGRDPHYDGISVQGGQKGVLIEGNTVIGRDTSDVFIKNDFGPISDVTVKGNLLLGDAGYTVYVDGRAAGGAITDVSIINNYVEKGYYGYYNVAKASPVISGNMEFLSGATPDGSLPPPTPDTPGPNADALFGSDGNDNVAAGAGDDTVFVKEGNDTVFGGDGNDVVGLSEGNDLGYGGRGDDLLFGFTGDDTIAGGTGNDKIYLGVSDDRAYGGDGNDVIFGGTGDPAVLGNDTIDGGAGADTIYSSAGDDLVDGGSGNDVIGLGAGNDTVIVKGADTVYGGDGNDVVIVDGASKDFLVTVGLDGALNLELIGSGQKSKFYGVEEIRTTDGLVIAVADILKVNIGAGGINLDLLGLDLLGSGGFGNPIGLPNLGLSDLGL